MNTAWQKKTAPACFLLLPLEEEGRLNDMPLRENSVERIFAYYRWTEMLEREPTPGGLVPGKCIQGRKVPHCAQTDALPMTPERVKAALGTQEGVVS